MKIIETKHNCKLVWKQLYRRSISINVNVNVIIQEGLHRWEAFAM